MKNSMKKLIIILIIALTTQCITYGQCTYFTKVISGNSANHSLGLKNDGTLWAWGTNESGQLGDGTIINKPSPTQIGTATNWVNIALGASHSLGITAEGKLWAWGSNNVAQLGDGTFIQRTTPTLIGTSTNWVSISAGGGHSLGITSDGKAWCWGKNDFGQLGDGTLIDKTIPTQIGLASNWLMISSGGSHSLGITSDGKAWAWGSNSVGQIGDGTLTKRTSPKQIGIATNWVKVSGGNNHSLGITSDGKAWGWGFNNYGQLGDGTTNTVQTSPTQIGISTNWVNITSGNHHSHGIDIDGKVWAWGENVYGQLGNGNNISSNIPSIIGTFTNWVSISAGAFHTLGITSNSKTFAWGSYNASLLSNSPTQINSDPNFSSLATSNSTSTQYQQSLINYATNCNSLIAQVTQNGTSPISGNTTSKVWLENTQPLEFVKRHYEITPALNSSTATGNVTLYFTQQEFTDFNSTSNIFKLPTSSNDVTGIANLRIDKYSGVSSDGTGLPNTYTGTPVTIDPVDANIVWNNTLSRWEVSFAVIGFSGFFTKTKTSTLPLNLIDFQVTKRNKRNILRWVTKNQINSHGFEIERSNDGVDFIRIAIVNANGYTEGNYEYNDENNSNLNIYYRLKIKDNDGSFSYSKIIFVSSDILKYTTIYPNPIGDFTTIQVDNSLLNTKALITDINGKVMQILNINQLSNTVQISSYSSGIYFFKLQNGEVFKMIKK